MKIKVGIVFVIISTLILLYLYGSFNPEDYPFPRCPFYSLTGLKCPGCGSQRALYQLLHFHIASAFQYNAMLVISIPVLVFIFETEVVKRHHPKLYSASHSSYFSWGLVVIVFCWWLLRNIFGW